MKKIVERSDGLYEDKDGYFVKIQNDEDNISKYRVPAFCPCCQNIMYNIDTRWFLKWGVCLNCSINFLEDRKLPDNLKSISDYQEYVKEKYSPKKK